MIKFENPINRLVDLDKPNTKVLVVFIAFFLMVLSSCLIMNNTLSRKLQEHAETSIADVQSLIEIVLTEPKVAFSFIADSIQETIVQGNGFEAVQELMRFYSSDEFKEGITTYEFDSIYGFFDVFGEFYDGGGWVPDDSYRPKERPWYISAVEDGKNIVISPVYVDTATKIPVIGYARCLYDNDGNLLGVVSMDLPVSFINDLMVSAITANSYGFLVDDQLIIIVHPAESMIGTTVDENDSDIAQILDTIRGHSGISRINFTDYAGISSILFSSETFNGWYVNFMVPAVEYYEDLYIMMSVVSLLGLIMAFLLSFLLVRIDAARRSSEQKSQQKSNFLANMSHEIRTPMNSIIGFSELALDDDVSPKTKHYLRSIADNSKWLLNIINDILDSSKIESGTIVLEHIPFDLQDVISQCQSAILPKAVEKGITMYCYAEPLDNKTLLGDPVRLRQVFMNLLSNAIKFTSDGYIKFLSSVRNVNDKFAIISFEVKDSGIGMTHEQMEKIFIPFMQADDTVTRNFGGTGLGLSITKNILDLMGSELSVESEPGSGSIFRFELKFDIVEAGTVELKGVVSTGRIDRPNFEGEVLICEDNGLNQQVICEHLNRVGLKTVIAENGQEAIDIIKERLNNIANGVSDKRKATSERPFDLIFMDIHMPIVDGLEASSRIVNMGVQTPIIALTANIMSNDLEVYKKHGMLDYLGKPFTSQDLWKCLLKYFSVVSYTVMPEDIHNKQETQSLNQLRLYFACSNDDTIEKITKALNDHDIKLAYRLVHTLKGNAGQIGETMLQKAASTIEELIKKDDISGAGAQLVYLETELRTVIKKLEPLKNEANEKSKSKITDPQKIEQIFTDLEQMLVKSNPECMKFLDDIRAIPGAEELANYVQDFEFKNAVNELVKLKEGWLKNE